jgi:hypothetical protein
MSEPKDPIEIRLGIMGEKMRLVKIEWDLFFAGQRKIPPTKEMSDLETFARGLKSIAIQDHVLRFRLESLFSNYVSMRELWSKRLKRQEEGGARPKPRFVQPEGTVEEGIVITHPAAQQSRIKKLYHEYLAQSDPERVKSLEFQMFSANIAQQVEALIRKTGCGGVQLRIQLEDGRVKVKAKPLKGV